MSLKAYPEYQRSDVDWLGEVPKNWELSSVRSVVFEVRERNDKGQEAVYLSLMANVGVLLYQDKGDVGNKKPEDLSKCKQVEIGDLVINSMNYGIGSYGISPYEGVCSQVYIILRMKDATVSREFVKRIFETTQFQKLAQSYGNGILEHRRSISWDTLKNLRIAVPPLNEQHAIAHFLDRETAEIDAFIADQEQLIALLTERRTATITHAVTKGLDPNAPTKESGIDWLGKIPSHWHVHNGRRYFSVRNERARSDDAQLAASQEYGVIEQQRYVELTGNRVVVVQKGFDILKHVERGDFVISMRSFQGGLEYSEVSGQISSAYVILTPSRPLVNQYFKYLFKSVISQDIGDSSASRHR